jgi:hypothetical protein
MQAWLACIRIVFVWLPDLDTQKKPKTLQDSPSHRILRHMHGTLNIDKKDN